MGSSPLQILVLSTYYEGNANVIRDYLLSFNAYSRHRYLYVFDCRTIEADFDFDRFDAILIFWSLYLPGGDLTESVMHAIARSRAVKLLFLQDEYREVRQINRIMARLGIQHMFSCVEPDQHEIFYPRSLVPSLETVHTVLTGYVPEYLKKYSRFRRSNDRPLDIGYRSRDLPYYLGDLAREKRIVAERFQEIAREYGFTTDISCREADRIYGKDWVRFIRSSRFSLGTPSGASVVDFSGEIRRNCERYLQSHPDASYEEVRERFFADVDGRVVIETISPRFFEAAALDNVLILHTGRYADVLEPDVHYIEVKRDYSNIPDVVTRMQDDAFCRSLRQHAYRDLIANGQYSYESFVRWFDKTLDTLLPLSSRSAPLATARFYWRSYRTYGQCLIPVGQRCLRLPSPQFLSRLLPYQRLAMRLRPSSPSPPEAPIAKALKGVRYAVARGVFRTMLRCSLPRSGRRVALRSLLHDAYRLSVLSDAQCGNLKTATPFRIVLRFSVADGRLDLGSIPIDQKDDPADSTGSSLPISIDQVRELARQGQIRSVFWDHSRVDRSLHFRLGRRRRASIYLDATGTSALPSLGRLLAIDVEAATRLLRPIAEAPAPDHVQPPM